MKKYNKSDIMKKAWEIRRANAPRMSMSAALVASWRIAKGGYIMTTQELINRYAIQEGFGPSTGRIFLTNSCAVDADGKDKVFAEVKARKQEILDYLHAERDARRAKINAIPGLADLRDAYADWADYRRRFSRSFDDVGGMGVGPRPAVSLDAMRKQYPAADAFLLAEGKFNSNNFEISAIGRDAMERIIANPADYAAAIADMDAAIKRQAAI